MLSRRRMLALLAASPAVGPVLAAPQAEFSTGIKIVSLLVTVRDKSGKFVNELEQDDFVVEDDGRPQTISYFSRQDDLPLTLGLLVDISASQAAVLGDELTASDVFFKQVLREGVDQAFLAGFATRAWLMQNVTVSRAKLQEGLGVLGKGLRDQRGYGGTVLYDAITDASDQIMTRLQGRKALVLLTDGEDTTSHGSLDQAVASCQRSDTVVYSIGIGTGLAGGASILETLSKRTGGGYFPVTRKQTVDLIYKNIEEELRSQYNIGYLPPPSAPGKNRAGFHKVRVTVKRGGTTVRARDGYFAAGG
jgi:Ca-activated chloride channel family protein